MTLRVVGAGLGRTGTSSLESALELLLGAPCYHMREVFEHPEYISQWHAAATGDMPEWETFLNGYRAAVDWPAAAFWRELSAAHPDALVLLSVRDPETWWSSASQTIFPTSRRAKGEWRDMIDAMFGSRFTLALTDKKACIDAFDRHVEEVRASVPQERLLVWQASEGWGPICERLGLSVPDQPFPRTNTREEWFARAGQHEAASVASP